MTGVFLMIIPFFSLVLVLIAQAVIAVMGEMQLEAGVESSSHALLIIKTILNFLALILVLAIPIAFIFGMVLLLSGPKKSVAPVQGTPDQIPKPISKDTSPERPKGVKPVEPPKS